MAGLQENLKPAEALSIRGNLEKQDLYRFPKKLPRNKFAAEVLKGGGICLGLSYLFYHSVIPGIVSLPVFLYYDLKRRTKIFVQERQRRFRGDFKDFAQMLSSLLLAGYSIENAMKKLYLQLVRSERDCDDLIEMLSCMLREIQVGENAEQVWLHFCRQLPIEEIRDFGQIFSLSKRSGASLPDVLRRLVKQLDLKIQTEEQIETLIAGKKMEQKIMNLMPAGILVYICMTSADMMGVMYTTVIGRLVMTLCLAVYLGAFLLSEKITASL